MDGNIQAYKQHIYALLRQETSGVLSTVRENGFPDAAFIYFVVDGEEIVFLTRHDSRKTLNIEYQNQVLLTVPNEPHKEVVHVRGQARVLEAQEARVIEIMGELSKRLQGDSGVETVLPLLKHHTGPVVLVKIIPTELRWRKYSPLGLEEERVSV